jgi:hypothetical protein
MDRQRSSHFAYSRQSTSSSTSLTPRHLCSLCGKSRSKRYHDQHPLLLGQIPQPGICSRSKCANVNEMLRLLCPVIIYEIHHHYHSSSGLEGPPPSYTAAELPLSDNTLGRDLSHIREEWPPSLNITPRPQETPPNYTAVELSGESSLTGRVELPDNRCSRRHAFRRVAPMPDELPPPVNFLKKPRLQEHK